MECEDGRLIITKEEAKDETVQPVLCVEEEKPVMAKRNLLQGRDERGGEEAYVYVIETNVIQRSFTDLAPSEKAAVLSARYEKVISQGNRRFPIEKA